MIKRSVIQEMWTRVILDNVVNLLHIFQLADRLCLLISRLHRFTILKKITIISQLITNH